MAQRIVAAQDLPAGTRLEPAHLVIRSFPAALVSSDSLPPERYTELSGAVLRAPLRSGDPILPVHATAHEAGAFSSRSEEHTSELQSLMRISYSVFCLKKKKNIICYKLSTQIHTTYVK